MKKVRHVVGAVSSAGLLGMTLFLGASAATVATAAPAVVHAPRIPDNGHGLKNTWAASNWSGYAETGSFTGVTGTWTVPTVTASPLSSTSYSAAWVGVDGFNNSNLIQTGTEEDFYNGAAHYYAWWEILPAAETPLPSSDVVNAGDTMKASIYETSTLSSGGGGSRGHTGRGSSGGGSQHVWVITIQDQTHPWSSAFTTNQAYNGPGASAEWVLEAPQVGGHIATLANYSYPGQGAAGDFDNAGVATSVVSSGAPSYTYGTLNYQADSGVMIQNNQQVSTPGNTNGSAFNVGYGATVPATPTS